MSIGIWRLVISSFFLLRLFRHFFVSFPESPHFTVMSAINATTMKWSKAQLRPRQPWTKMVTPLASSALSTSAPLSSAGGRALEAIMAQLVCMDACLDTLSDELCQVKTHVGRIAQW